MQLQRLFVVILATTLAAAASGQRAGDAEHVWDLTDLYPSVDAWQRARQDVIAQIESLAAYRGTLRQSAARLYAALDAISSTARAAQRVSVYASLERDQDLRVTDTQERAQLADIMYARFGEAIAWLRPEIIEIGRPRIESFVAAEPRLAPFAHELDDTLRQAEHTLSPESERVLSLLARSADAPSDIYSVLANSDIPFPTLMLSTGESVRIDSQGYNRWRAHPNRDDRKRVFDAYWSAWNDYRNSTGLVLNAHIQTQVALAKARKFDSVLERELFEDNLPLGVYRTLVAEVNKALPTLHRYFALRGRMLGIGQMHYYDIYPPLVSLDQSFDIEATKSITLAAMSILGEDWVDMQRKGIESRWMHVHPQQGKRSGAYMNGSAYGVHPYLLLNHSDDYESLSTFAHEWGHAMHTLYAWQAQPFETADYATFTAEIPSTSLELILQRYMLEHAESVDEQLFYLGSALENLRGTFFRQTMFAEFELSLYEAAERGEALSGERITELYRELVRRYHGHDEGVVIVDELYANEWMFVPHFYYNMYVFQYATSLTAGTALYDKIIDEGAAGVANYKDLLRAGGSDYPYELLVAAGVDLARPEPYRTVVEQMNAIMDRMEALLDSQN